MSEYMDMAQALKSEGKYLESLSMLGMAAKENKYDYTVYYAMGKLYYLMNDTIASVKHYLISLHLHILDITESDQRRAADIMLMDLPDKAKNMLQNMHEKAAYILTDINTPRHIAHAFIDIDQDIMERGYIEQYRSSISGNIEDLEIKNREFDFYYMLGIDFCINSMDFTLAEHDIIIFYLNKSSDEMESVFKGIYNKFTEQFDKEKDDSNNP